MLKLSIVHRESPALIGQVFVHPPAVRCPVPLSLASKTAKWGKTVNFPLFRQEVTGTYHQSSLSRVQ